MKNFLIQVFEYFFLLWHKTRNWLHSLVSFVHALWLPTNFFCIYSPTIGSSNKKNIQLDVTHKMVISARQCFCSFAHFTESNKWKSLRNITKLIFFRWFLCWTEKNPSKQIVMAAAKYKKKYTNISGSQWNVFFFISVCYKNLGAQSEIVNDFFPGHWHGMEMALLENCN